MYQLILALGELGYLNDNLAALRLQRAYLGTESMMSLQYDFTRIEDKASWNALIGFDPDNPSRWFNELIPERPEFDGQDRWNEVQRLGDSSMAYVMSKIDDPWGFKNLCNTAAATDVHNDIIDSLMPSLYAEHINRHLWTKGIESLHKLRSNPTVIDQFKAKVTSDLFDPFGRRTDLQYAMTLLFVYEYFCHGPGYRANRDPLRISSLPVIEKWSSKLANSNDNSQLKLAKYCFLTGGVFSPQGRASTTVQDTRVALESIPAGDTSVSGFRQLLANPDSASGSGTIFDERLLNEFGGISRNVWNKWRSILDDQSTSTFWQSGIRSALSASDTIKQPFGPNFSIVTMTTTTVTHAPNLESWCAARAGQSYMSQTSVEQLKNKESVTRPIDVFDPAIPDNVGPPLVITCFIADTQILTDTGNVPIQDLREGDRVCTRLEPTQWGVRSCEVVESPAPKMIHGFNDEPAFFTAGHVFHTTTGLRALRPDAALAENPWLECGQLSVGDQLLRIGADSKYETVPIRAITSEEMTGKFVYGVHLHEGLRSYHANGYLVALNYPEITVSMVAKRLMELPPGTRVAALRTVKELKPLFHQFGATTVLEVLSKESETAGITFGGKAEAARPTLTRDLDMPYTMFFPSSSQYGPQIELSHGVLYVDGKFCPQADFSKTSVAWSRQLADATWEHASCDFHNNSFQAFGYVVYTSEEEEYTQESLVSRSIAFELTPGVLETGQPPMSALTNGNSTETSATNGFRPLEDRKPISFSLAYDPSIYDPDQKTENRPTVRCGNILLPTEGNRYVYAKLALKEYDQVQTKLYEKAQAENPQISKPIRSQLYKHTVRYDARQIEHHKFELLQAQVLIEASDEFPVWKAENLSEYLDLEPPLKNLHYTNLGLDADFVVAEVFKTIEVQKSLPDASGLISFSGLARSYASMAEGNEGYAHVIVGTYVKPTTLTPASASQEAISSAQSLNTEVTRAHQLPHPFAKAMAVADVPTNREDRIAALGNIALDLPAVNSSAQTTMTNIMQWHMEEGDRKLFFGSVDRPLGLPAELTTMMQNTPEATWIREIYARAYICQVMSQQEEGVGKDYRFTAQEKKNIRYFWNGKGRDCLSKSPIYHKLERAISRFEIRKRYDVIGTICREGSGVDYSNDLYRRWSSDLQIGSLPDVNPATGTTLLSKICTIMDALDDGAKIERQISEEVNKEATMTDTNSNHLVVAAMADQKGSIWLSQYWGLKDEDERNQLLEKEWLEDALKDLVRRILAKDSSITGPVSTALQGALDKYAKEVAEWEKMNFDDKMRYVLVDFGDRMTDVVRAAGKLLGWVGGIWEKGRQKVASWINNTQALGDAVDLVMNQKPIATGKRAFLSAGLFIAGAMAFGVSIWYVTNSWSKADPLDRSLMLLTIIAALNQMATFGIELVYMVMRWRSVAFSEATEIAICSSFDMLTGRQMGTKWSAVYGNALHTGEVRLRAEAAFTAASEINPLNPAQANFANQEYGRLADLMPIKKAFNIARTVIAIIGCILAVGMAIVLTWSLVSEWAKLSETSKIFQTVLLILQWVESLLAVVVIGGYIAWGAVSYFGASFATVTAVGTFAVATASLFAAVSMVVAILSIAVLVAWFIIEMKNPPPPAPSAVEIWMQKYGKPWATGHAAPPDPVSASLSPTFLEYSSDLQNVNATFASSQQGLNVDLDSITLKFTSGPDHGAFFNGQRNFIVSGESKEGCVRVEGLPLECVMTVSNAPSTIAERYTQTSVFISRARKSGDAMQSFRLPYDKPIKITIGGVVKDENGSLCSMSWDVFASNGDTTEGQVWAYRKPSWNWP
ncbi:hypothetical protein HJFPF1_12244 [Paramyrothecium foliicola]|nr:hypothetical protein HJFPF1_12244 [Paramyrothecium foliicola]